MTLTTHIAIAGAFAKPLAKFNPFFSFAVALLSHYISDAIPHWDYPMHSIERNSDGDHISRVFSKKEISEKFIYSKLLKDLRNVAMDFFLGVLVILILARPENTHDFIWATSVIAGAVLPDFFQGVYFLGKVSFLKPLQKFHDKMHTKIKLGNYPFLGIPFQVIIFIGAIIFI